MTLRDLDYQYDILQKKYGDSELQSIYNGGCENNPKILFVFMNPTGRNIASQPGWKGIRAPWIGTKMIWDVFWGAGLFDSELHHEIKAKRSSDWTEEFAKTVYDEIARQKLYITNFAKCTLKDARPVPNKIYAEYLPLLEEEIKIINPEKIVLFGNQVSSIFLNRPISVTRARRIEYKKVIQGTEYKCYSVFYPIGNGRVNIDKAIDDIKWIISGEKEYANCI